MQQMVRFNVDLCPAIDLVMPYLEIGYKTPHLFPQWGAADAEIKVSSGENTELNRSPFKARSRSVYSHTCYT